MYRNEISREKVLTYQCTSSYCFSVVVRITVTVNMFPVNVTHAVTGIIGKTNHDQQRR